MYKKNKIKYRNASDHNSMFVRDMLLVLLFEALWSIDFYRFLFETGVY